MLKKLIHLWFIVLVLGILPSTLNAQPVTKLEINEIIIDSTLNVRALEAVSEDGCVFVTSDGRIGAVLNSGEEDNNLIIRKPVHVLNDSTAPNFRSLALTSRKDVLALKVFALSIGNPAKLYNFGEEEAKLVYSEEHEKVFYDSMEFWNSREGLAIGDPTSECMSIIITRDGGQTWNKMDCSELPPAAEGEAAFAASDTNIAIFGEHTWVATGGKASRILYSPDKGNTWNVFRTPIIQGKETTGMYSIDFYDVKTGYAIGGDYTDPDNNSANKIRTRDGGRTWELINGGPGYRSCVQYVPGSDGKELVAVGFKGIDYSSDGGLNWVHLSDEGFYTIRFTSGRTAYAAGKGRVSRIKFK